MSNSCSKLEIGKLYKLVKQNHKLAYGDKPNTFKLSQCIDAKNPISKSGYRLGNSYESLITMERTYCDNSVLYIEDIVVLLNIINCIDTKFITKNFGVGMSTVLTAEMHKILYGENSVCRDYCILVKAEKLYYCPKNEFEYCFEKLEE